MIKPLYLTNEGLLWGYLNKRGGFYDMEGRGGGKRCENYKYQVGCLKSGNAVKSGKAVKNQSEKKNRWDVLRKTRSGVVTLEIHK